MSTTLELQECHQDTDDEPDLIHVVCSCNEDVALCGTDVSGECWMDSSGDDPDDCIVCIHLEHRPCSRCGEIWA